MSQSARLPSLKSRLPEVGTTIFTEISALAKEHQAINVGQGFPDFSPPQALIDRLYHHLNHGANQYAPMAGAPLLLDAIGRKIERVYQRSIDAAQEVTVTCGGTEALTVSIQALVHPGDEVILIDPAYDSYAPIVKLCGARAIRVPLTLDGFAVDWQRVGEAMSDKTKLLVINNPHNPTGSCWRSEDLDQLEDLVERWPMWVLADEVYEHMVFDQHTHQSLHLRESLAQRSIIVASFGKTYHMTGWKIGYCVAPKYLTTEIRKIHQFVTFAISHPMQLALADFLEAHPEWDEQLSGFYQAKRDRMITALAGSAFKCTPTPSTYFQVVDYSDITNIDDTHFVRQLITKWGVASIPLSVFYEKPNHAKRIRLCFAKSDDVIDQACARLSQISAGAF